MESKKDTFVTPRAARVRVSRPFPGKLDLEFDLADVPSADPYSSDSFKTVYVLENTPHSFCATNLVWSQDYPLTLSRSYVDPIPPELGHMEGLNELVTVIIFDNTSGCSGTVVSTNNNVPLNNG